MTKYCSLKGPSLSSFSKSLILTYGISLAFLLGWNPSTSAIIVFSWVGALISYDNCNRYRCCITCSKYKFTALKWLIPLCHLSLDILLLWFRLSTVPCFVHYFLWQPLPLLYSLDLSCYALNCASCVMI